MRTVPTLTSLLLCLICSPAGAAPGDQHDTSRASVEQRRQADAIAAIESSQGAYAAALTEPLLSLGKLLQRQGRHKEALALFKRGVHLARITGGLSNPDQIPVLKAAIKSHIALRNYERADERQSYLYRIQSDSLSSSYALTVAYMQQAQWQFDAFLLGIDEPSYARLMKMAELYANARDDVIKRRGDRSRNLLQPLLGLLQTQYLIASYSSSSQHTGSSEAPSRNRDRYRFAFYQQRVDAQVREIIAHLARLERPGLNANQWQAETGVMLGDWLLWGGEREKAMAIYQANAVELDAARDAQGDSAEGLLDQPVALPALAGIRGLPREAAQGGENTVQLSFDVTASGRVVNLQRLDENEALNGRANRLMRTLRKSNFRPRFVAGMPVETKNIVKYFVINL